MVKKKHEAPEDFYLVKVLSSERRERFEKIGAERENWCKMGKINEIEPGRGPFKKSFVLVS